MHDFETSASAGPFNAFSPRFLERFSREDEPLSAGEADLDGPWEIRPPEAAQRGLGRSGFTIWRQGERASHGDLPVAVLDDRATALLACALRPLLGRDPLLTLETERGPQGFPVLRSGEPCGWIQLFEEQWIFGLNLLERFVRSPASLALLLEAAGPLALERAGRLLNDRVEPEDPSQGGNDGAVQ